MSVDFAETIKQPTGERRRVLLLVHRVPYPPNRGDRIRSYQILRYLDERYDVSLATLADEPVSVDTKNRLEALCSQVTIRPVSRFRWLKGICSLLRGKSATQGLFHSRELSRDLQQWWADRPFDAIVVFCSSMAPYLDALPNRDIPVVIDLVDVDSQKFEDYARHSKTLKAWLYRREAKSLRVLETASARRASAITLVSEAEAELFRQICPNYYTHAMPNGVDLDYFSPTCATSQVGATLVFTGALDYQPNIDGIVWFTKNVWPLIRAELPDATLSIVGRCPTQSVVGLNGKNGIRVYPSVSDVRPYLAGATLAIAPLRIARGIQNKVLEAMAMGKPVVCSPAALEGLVAKPGRDVFVADSPTQWSEVILQLLSSPTQADELACNAAKYVAQFHDWQSNLAVLTTLLEGRAEANAFTTSEASAEYANT